ncbi:thiosulfate oxidation carrier complex protein SoxZ [Thiothrix nivea]|uniref:Sulfur compound chelating protein SoxZ n=1 Tax=Thiothrix nivea (strain ATCC 35100 / DSM 5205 / JP2) TaxID=870187 RepID=A0A656HE34_THINJ|nr:thiosulfate oxidation carrier complex protein SoxZ [Thiothrix nivea]EIJ34663.1 sulfur oxidation protein SoxZ [Thiothrix nivea DSM 5205]EIJ34667.1 sulfur compound chelating protein SoxZ [Thiothrix nivea DSM 5205]
MSSIKLKAKADGDTVEVKALMTHPMETGQRKDKKTGELVPAHFISEIVVTAGDKTVMTANWGASVSKNPYLAFNYAGKAGDKVKLTWKDNKGETDSAETDAA